MKVTFSNIRWDTSAGDCQEYNSEPDLPNKVTLTVDDDTDVDTEGADVLSDRYGFCVFGFDYQVEPKGE